MVAGADAASADMEYILFLDANCHVHPGTVTTMVFEMMRDGKIFATPGFPLDVPQSGATVWAWAMCQFRYAVLCEFSRHRTNFAWGGAMLMRKAEIDNDECEIKTRWLNGGYSDDMLVGAAALDHGRTICTPVRALFPNTVKRDVTLCQLWDFLHRQAFALTTCSSGRHCCAVSSMLLVYGVFNCIPLPALLLSLFTTSTRSFCAIAARSADPLRSYDLALSMLFIVALACCMDLQQRYLRRCFKLAQSLSPGQKFTEFHMSRTMQLASFLWQTSLAPLIALSTMDRTIKWGGILYRIGGGRVWRVYRP